MKRKRIPYYFPHSKFDLWRDLVADPNEGDEINDEYEDFGKLTYLSIYIRGCQRCNFELQSVLNSLNLKWQLVEHVG